MNIVLFKLICTAVYNNTNIHNNTNNTNNILWIYNGSATSGSYRYPYIK